MIQAELEALNLCFEERHNTRVTGSCGPSVPWRAGNAGDTISVVIYSELPVICLESLSHEAPTNRAHYAIIKDAKLRIFCHMCKFEVKNDSSEMFFLLAKILSIKNTTENNDFSSHAI